MGFFKCITRLRLSKSLAAIALVYGGCVNAEPLGGLPAKSVEREMGESDLVLRLVLLGDAGEPSERLLETAKTWISIEPKRTIAVFLGDNAYPDGLTGPDSAKAHRHLMRLTEPIQICGVQSIFAPGNHDLGPRYDDWGALEAQAKATKKALPDVFFLPASGCAGPAIIKDKDVSIIVVNSPAWMINPKGIPKACDAGTQVMDSLEKLLKVTAGPTVLVSHHPVFSYGKHAGYYTWKDQLFPLTIKVPWLYIPLPLAGSIYLLAKSRLFASSQDFRSSEYRVYRTRMLHAISGYAGPKPLIFVSGHEHNMQVISHGDKGLFLISGAGSKWKLENVRSGKETLFATAREGFLVLDFHSRTAVVTAVEVGREQPVFSKNFPIKRAETIEGRVH